MKRDINQRNLILAMQAHLGWSGIDWNTPVVAPFPFDFMPQTKIDGFMEEFPFVGEYLSLRSVLAVYVQGFESGLIERELVSVEVPCLTHETIDHEWAYLLDEDGKLVAREDTRMAMKKPYWFFGPRLCFAKRVPTEVKSVKKGIAVTGGSIGETLLKLGEKASEVKMILSYHAFTMTAILYKVRGLSIVEWRQRRVDAEKESFKAELAAI